MKVLFLGSILLLSTLQPVSANDTFSQNKSSVSLIESRDQALLNYVFKQAETLASDSEANKIKKAAASFLFEKTTLEKFMSDFQTINTAEKAQEFITLIFAMDYLFAPERTPRQLSNTLFHIPRFRDFHAQLNRAGFTNLNLTVMDEYLKATYPVQEVETVTLSESDIRIIKHSFRHARYVVNSEDKTKIQRIAAAYLLDNITEENFMAQFTTIDSPDKAQAFLNFMFAMDYSYAPERTKNYLGENNFYVPTFTGIEKRLKAIEPFSNLNINVIEEHIKKALNPLYVKLSDNEKEPMKQAFDTAYSTKSQPTDPRWTKPMKLGHKVLNSVADIRSFFREYEYIDSPEKAQQLLNYMLAMDSVIYTQRGKWSDNNSFSFPGWQKIFMRIQDVKAFKGLNPQELSDQVQELQPVEKEEESVTLDPQAKTQKENLLEAMRKKETFIQKRLDQSEGSPDFIARGTAIAQAYTLLEKKVNEASDTPTLNALQGEFNSKIQRPLRKLAQDIRKKKKKKK